LTDSETATIYRPKGCGRCGHSGYEGRVGVYEIAVIDEKLKTLIHDNAGEQEMISHAFRNSHTLAQSGFSHVKDGVTSVEEVLRVIRQENEDAGV